MCLEAKVFLDTYMSIALGHNKCMQIIQPSWADVTTAAAPTPSNMATKMTINLAELQYKNSHWIPWPPPLCSNGRVKRTYW